MRKQAIILALTFPIFMSLLGQSTISDTSYFNFEIGHGYNYGIIGTKSVIGYKNSGLLIGLGTMPGNSLGFQIGGQLSYSICYANVGYGTVGSSSVFSESFFPMKAISFVAGIMIPITKDKRLIIDIGIGHVIGSAKYTLTTTLISPFSPPKTSQQSIEKDHNELNLNIGIGYRF